MNIGQALLYLLHLIGSAAPLAILCYMLVFLAKGKKVKVKTVVSYLVVGTIMLFILLRT